MNRVRRPAPLRQSLQHDTVVGGLGGADHIDTGSLVEGSVARQVPRQSRSGAAFRDRRAHGREVVQEETVQEVVVSGLLRPLRRNRHRLDDDRVRREGSPATDARDLLRDPHQRSKRFAVLHQGFVARGGITTTALVLIDRRDE